MGNRRPPFYVSLLCPAMWAVDYVESIKPQRIETYSELAFNSDTDALWSKLKWITLGTFQALYYYLLTFLVLRRVFPASLCSHKLPRAGRRADAIQWAAAERTAGCWSVAR